MGCYPCVGTRQQEHQTPSAAGAKGSPWRRQEKGESLEAYLDRTGAKGAVERMRERPVQYLAWLEKETRLQCGKPPQHECGRKCNHKPKAQQLEEATSAVAAVLEKVHGSGRTLVALVEAYDGDKDGRLTHAEFVKMLVDNGATQESAALVAGHADHNGDGFVDNCEVFKELALDLLVPRLLKAHLSTHGSFRDVFKTLDPRDVGYVETAHLEELLLHMHVAPATAKAMMLAFDPHGVGRLDYKELHAALCLEDQIVKGQAQRTIRAVLVVTRHGARFPLKAFPGLHNWPVSKLFWDGEGEKGGFKGQLTPKGVKQHVHLGRMLRAKYVREERLLDPSEPGAATHVRVVSSNSDRTFKSAMALVGGMFPEMPQRFLIDTETREMSCDLESILIKVVSQEYTPLLHGFKNNPAYDALLKAAQKKSRFKEWGQDERYKKLLDKLWKMTKFGKLNPEKGSPEKLLTHMQSFQQQMSIERAHGMPILENDEALRISEEEENDCIAVADYICRLRYCGNSEADQVHISRLAAGLLPKEVLRVFEEAKRNPDAEDRFVLLSAHDNTLMAMLAFLGFKDFPIPWFAANLCFELHEMAEGDFRVKVLYNPNPEEYAFHSEGTMPAARYVRMPAGKGVVSFPQAKEGDMTYAEFTAGLAARGAFESEEEWAEAAKGDPADVAVADSARKMSEGHAELLRDATSCLADTKLEKCQSKLSKVLAIEQHAKEELEKATAEREKIEATLKELEGSCQCQEATQQP